MGANVDNLTGNNDNTLKKKHEEEYVDDVDDLDGLTIRGIFMDEGLIKKKDVERERRLLYKDIHCEKSLYLFSKKNPFRLFLYKIIFKRLYAFNIFDRGR